MKFVNKHIHLILLLVFSVLVLTINVRINNFRYNNFDYGKFDLGNMTQMVWNTLHGRFMYLTDYFGTNLPRWAMSHVDPILILFVPLFAFYQSPLLLVYSQLVLVIFSSFLVYLIAFQELKSKWAALLLACSYLLYPAIGFLTAWTGFHGVTAAMPFFFGAFYVFERMSKSGNFSRNGIILFWTLLVLLMSGKEELGLYVILLGLFVLLYRSTYQFSGFKSFFSRAELLKYFKLTPVKLGISMVVIGAFWFTMAFFVIIPAYAHYRIEGFERFAASLDIDPNMTRSVDMPNYFLERYSEFGDSYTSVALGMLTQPKKVVSVFFGGDKLDNLNRTMMPLLYFPLLNPAMTLLSLPDFAINYLTTLNGIGTSEIYNHRISMIVPVLFVSVIYSIGLLSKFLFDLLSRAPVFQRIKLTQNYVVLFLALVMLSSNLYTTYVYNNPVFLWFTQAVGKRLAGSVVYAKTDIGLQQKDLKIGDVVRISMLDSNDRQCASKIVKTIPDGVSISGPDYLGAHLSMRETYAIFPALYKEADYVIVDVFSRKILTILDVRLSLVRDVVGDLMTDKQYELVNECGNLFVFKKVGFHEKSDLLPLQERFKFDEKVNLELFQSLTVVDYKYPQEVVRGKSFDVSFSFTKRSGNSLDSYILFTSLMNAKTGELFQLANLPSFGIKQLPEWESGLYYIENSKMVIPKFIEPGDYRVFIGMTNNIRTRSLYLGDIRVD